MADLNRRARALLRDAGCLGPDVLCTSDRAFAVGDRIVATRNDPGLAAVNGRVGTLTAFHDGRVRVGSTSAGASTCSRTGQKPAGELCNPADACSPV